MVSLRCALLLPIFLLAGCELTAEVTGMLGGSEPLSGSITLYDDGGTIELRGGPKTRCVGNFLYERDRSGLTGNGTMVCDDRRTGPFRFVTDGPKHGQGSGTLNSQYYSFRF